MIGGKAKPLKAPKKEKKDMDDDDLAFQAKQKAGVLMKRSCAKGQKLIRPSRRKGQQGDGREGKREGSTQRWAARYQKVWEEIGSWMTLSVYVLKLWLRRTLRIPSHEVLGSSPSMVNETMRMDWW